MLCFDNCHWGRTFPVSSIAIGWKDQLPKILHPFYSQRPTERTFQFKRQRTITIVLSYYLQRRDASIHGPLECIKEIPRNVEQEDELRWQWIADVNYATKSDYRTQFTCQYQKIKLCLIWRDKMEPKCCFLAWTLLHKNYHGKQPSEERVVARPFMKLCKSHSETLNHLCQVCP